MPLTSTFLDPSGNGIDVVDVATLLGLIVAATTAVIAAAKFFRRVLREEISTVVDEKLSAYTVNIQPGYRNGGGSLTDIGEGIKEILRRFPAGDEA